MKSFEGSFRNLNFSPSTSISFEPFLSIYRYYMFFLTFKTSVLSNNRFAKPFKVTSFSRATMVMRFPAKTNVGCPKAPRDFPPRKDGILQPPSGCLGTLLPFPRVCTGGRTLTSQPKFLGSIGYQICLAMELRWQALPAGSAINVHKCCLTHGGLASQNRENVFIENIMIKLFESFYSN